MSFLESLFDYIPKLNKHGINIILIIAVISLIVSLFSNTLGTLLFIIVIFSLYFFRDPDRVSLGLDGAIFSPADGTITHISETTIPAKFFRLDGDDRKEIKAIKISIFLSIFDVHVNRSPVNGTIRDIIYSPGKFVSAMNEKESTDNESNTLLIETNQKELIVVTQIAGLIARRIVCDKKNNERMEQGERFGIIKFGSRVNIYIPLDYKILVKKGQKMIGGETMISIKNNCELSKINDKTESSNE